MSRFQSLLIPAFRAKDLNFPSTRDERLRKSFPVLENWDWWGCMYTHVQQYTIDPFFCSTKSSRTWQSIIHNFFQEYLHTCVVGLTWRVDFSYATVRVVYFFWASRNRKWSLCSLFIKSSTIFAVVLWLTRIYFLMPEGVSERKNAATAAILVGRAVRTTCMYFTDVSTGLLIFPSSDDCPLLILPLNEDITASVDLYPRWRQVVPYPR